MKIDLYGNYTALVTPFLDDGNVDFASLEKLLKYQVQNNTDGLVLFGSTGEGHLLSMHEKDKILALAKKVTREKIPLIVSILSYTTIDCAQEIQHFSELFADAFLIAPPPYIRPTTKGMIDHFETLANISVKPIILYNIPTRAGVEMSFECIKALSQHENIIGIKEASPSFDLITKECAIINDNFKMLCGNDNFMLPMMSLGASGAVSVIGNIYPDFVHNLFEIFKLDSEEALKIYKRYSHLIGTLTLETNPIPIIEALFDLKLVKPNLRAPLSRLDEEKREKIYRALKML